MSTNTDQFSRGQAEIALWQQFREGVIGAPKDPRPVFSACIKRLLDIDRESARDQDARQSYAFLSDPPRGRGHAVAYRAFDVFNLGVALDMLDAGFKQSEVVFFAKHARPMLQQAYRKIMDGPKPDRGRKTPDWRVFMVVRRLEFNDMLARKGRPEDADKPIFLEPKFLYGGKELATYLDKNSWPFRKAYIAELAKVAHYTTSYLQKAPEVRRGPG